MEGKIPSERVEMEASRIFSVPPLQKKILVETSFWWRRPNEFRATCRVGTQLGPAMVNGMGKGER
ncbi:MAG: hypothetical protein DRN83_02520 [Hadesarchaea archaeon]|nr:MAG: hypothetical protein DRN83_02520 [Hadesarchaea archaeon]